jgi:hypothetical protein
MAVYLTFKPTENAIETRYAHTFVRQVSEEDGRV